MQITQGKIDRPVKGVFYGPEGVGKSTLASQLPQPLFIDVESGTSRLAVARTQRPTSWPHLKEIILELTRDTMGFETLIIDTADRADALGVQHVCQTHGMSALGGQGDYGHSYGLHHGLWEDLLAIIDTDLYEAGRMHVVFLAHSATKKFELPEEVGQFDRYQLAVEKRTAETLKGWADLLLFCNFKTIVTTETSHDGKVIKAKGHGGTQRVCYAEHSAAFDAKNRHGLPRDFDMGYELIAKCFSPLTPSTTTAPAPGDDASSPVVDSPPGAGASTLGAEHTRLAALLSEADVTYTQLLTIMVDRGKAVEGTAFADLNTDLINKWILPHFDKIRDAIKTKGEATND